MKTKTNRSHKSEQQDRRTKGPYKRRPQYIADIDTTRTTLSLNYLKRNRT